jgi:hypothetical protein
VFLVHQAKAGTQSLHVREGDDLDSHVRDMLQEGLPLY